MSSAMTWTVISVVCILATFAIAAWCIHLALEAPTAVPPPWAYHPPDPPDLPIAPADAFSVDEDATTTQAIAYGRPRAACVATDATVAVRRPAHRPPPLPAAVYQARTAVRYVISYRAPRKPQQDARTAQEAQRPIGTW